VIDLPLPLIHVLAVGVCYLVLHPFPHIFYGVEVWAVVWSLDEADAGPVVEPPLHHNPRLVAGDPILQEVGSAMDLNEHFQLVIQQLPVHHPIPHLPLIEELQPSTPF
jgi:hypothetical protein